MAKKMKPRRKAARSPRYIMECTAGRYEAASWVGSEIIRVDEVVPASAARSMRSAVSG